MKNSEENVLFHTLHAGNWEKVRYLLERDNAIQLAQHDRRYNFGRNLLHCACCVNAPLDIVETVYNIRPHLITQEAIGGFTPLHHACLHASEAVVEFLLRKAPHTATVTDKDGWVPVEAAIFRKRDPSVLRKLLTALPPVTFDATTYLSMFIAVWQAQIEQVYPELDKLPRDDGLDTNDDATGVAKFTQTFSLLISAYKRGTVEDSESRGRRFLLTEALCLKKEITIPNIFVQVLLDFATVDSYLQSDESGNFLLHLVCTLPPQDK